MRGLRGRSPRRDRLDLDHELRTVEFRDFHQRDRGRGRWCDRCKEAVARLTIEPEMGHVGDEVERTEAFGLAILTLCIEVGGTITGEHGVGMEKIQGMCQQFGPGGETWLRFNFATPRPILAQALDRLDDVFADLRA